MAHRSRRTRALALAFAPMAAFIADPAFADQFKQAADGAGIDCSVSAHELTRFALVDDQFASVSKIPSRSGLMIIADRIRTFRVRGVSISFAVRSQVVATSMPA